MIKHTILILSCLTAQLKLQAQASPDFEALGELAYKYATEDIDSCYIYADSIANLARSQSHEYWIAKAGFYQALCQRKSENFNEAQILQEKFQEYAVKNSLKEDHALSLFHLAHVYRGLDRSDQELESINGAMKMFQEMDNQRMLAKSKVSKGTYWRVKRNFDGANNILNEAMSVYKAIEDSTGIAETYNELALVEASQGNMKEALVYFEIQNKIYEKTNNKVGLSLSLGNIGFANLRLNNIDKGEAFIQQAYEMRKELKNPERISMSLIQLAEVKVLRKEWPKALDLSEQALEMSKEFEIDFNISQCYRQISYIYEKMGRSAKALEYYKDYENLKDKLLNEKIAKSGQRIEAAYQTAEKEKQILKLETEDQLNEARISQQKTIIGGSLLGLALLSFMFYRVRLKNRQINNQNTLISKALGEKEILLKEIHHRVKNNLQVISSLLGLQSRSIEDEKAKEAILEGRTRVHSMSLIHQNLYQKDNLTGIEMETYLSKLSRNLYDSYRVEHDTISIETDIDELKLDVETVIPVGLIVNELISNSLKYAFPNKKEGTIKVSLKENNNQLILTVADNGIGLDDQVMNQKQESFGHTLIKAFKNKLNAELSIKSQNGTTVELKIKNYKKVA